MRITNRKAWWNYEKQKYIRKIQLKEESLRLHIIEMDELRAENKRLVLKLNEKTVNEANEIFCNCLQPMYNGGYYNGHYHCVNCGKAVAK